MVLVDDRSRRRGIGTKLLYNHLESFLLINRFFDVANEFPVFMEVFFRFI